MVFSLSLFTALLVGPRLFFVHFPVFGRSLSLTRLSQQTFFQIPKYFLLRANHQSVWTWIPEIGERFHSCAHTGRRVHVALRAIDPSPPLASPPRPAPIRAHPSPPVLHRHCSQDPVHARLLFCFFCPCRPPPTYDVPWPLRYVCLATGASRGTQSARDRRGDGSSACETGVASCLQRSWSF